MAGASRLHGALCLPVCCSAYHAVCGLLISPRCPLPAPLLVPATPRNSSCAWSTRAAPCCRAATCRCCSSRVGKGRRRRRLQQRWRVCGRAPHSISTQRTNTLSCRRISYFLFLQVVLFSASVSNSTSRRAPRGAAAAPEGAPLRRGHRGGHLRQGSGAGRRRCGHRQPRRWRACRLWQRCSVGTVAGERDACAAQRCTRPAPATRLAASPSPSRVHVHGPLGAAWLGRSAAWACGRLACAAQGTCLRGSQHTGLPSARGWQRWGLPLAARHDPHLASAPHR